MDIAIRNIVYRKWFQEAIVLVFAFVLFTMNDWILIATWKGFWKACVYFMILFTHAQLNRFLLLPILVEKHKPLLYGILTVLLLLICSYGLFQIANFWLYKNCFLYKSVVQQSYLYHIGLMSSMLITIMGPVFILKYYREQKSLSAKVLLTNQMQLDSLKTQLNPHFLFNTFNTLYGISLQFPERTPDLIMQVAQLMRYQVDNTNKDMVSLDQELTFIESYIGLEKERVGHRCLIEYNKLAQHSNQYKIAPMLLIAFVENAFKHGTDTIESCFVRISVRLEENILKLEIVNSLPKKKSKVISTKIGIKNTKERLDILYPGKYSLKMQEEESQYIVQLHLQLQ